MVSPTSAIILHPFSLYLFYFSVDVLYNHSMDAPEILSLPDWDEL